MATDNHSVKNRDTSAPLMLEVMMERKVEKRKNEMNRKSELERMMGRR